MPDPRPGASARAAGGGYGPIGPIAARVGARLAALDEHLGFGVGRLSGEGWIGLDQVVPSGLLDRLAADLVARGAKPDVAGSYLSSRLVEPLVGRTGAAMVLSGRCPDPDPVNVRLRLHPEGWFDRLSFTGERIALVAHDPAPEAPEVVILVNRGGLRAWWAERIVAAVAPVLEEVRSRLPAGAGASGATWPTRSPRSPCASIAGGAATAAGDGRRPTSCWMPWPLGHR